jgi:hypothetical protein
MTRKKDQRPPTKAPVARQLDIEVPVTWASLDEVSWTDIDTLLTRGKKITQGGKKGGSNKREKYKSIIEDREEAVDRDIRDYRREHPKDKWSKALENVAEKHRCSEGTVRGDLKRKGIKNKEDYDKLPT